MVLKYVKPYIWAVLLVIFLIVCQAMMELSLPEYMSNIVNVGIGQSGIENPSPAVIRKTEMEKLFPQGTEIYSHYISVPKGEEAVYHLSENT
ncbi:MAG: hypothetical protein LBU94_04690, partial [Clostridiales bacterium]|nr:hypothetical protein [Clostridiales bacterium]